MKSAEYIAKFMWIPKQRNNIFAFCYGNNIRMGGVSEDLRVRTGNRLKITIDKPIRDFELQLDNHNVSVHVIDTEGSFYRT